MRSEIRDVCPSTSGKSPFAIRRRDALAVIHEYKRVMLADLPPDRSGLTQCSPGLPGRLWSSMKFRDQLRDLSTGCLLAKALRISCVATNFNRPIGGEYRLADHVTSRAFPYSQRLRDVSVNSAELYFLWSPVKVEEVVAVSGESRLSVIEQRRFSSVRILRSTSNRRDSITPYRMHRTHSIACQSE